MRTAVALALVSSLLVARTASADEPRPRAPSADPAGKRTELGAFPIVGGDSDIGLGVGALGALTRLDPSNPPFAWNVEAGLFATFKPPGGERPFRLPYQDYYVQFTIPHLLSDALRLEIRPSFTRETTQQYYGIGNASPETSPSAASGSDDPGSLYYQYGRTHPTLVVRARLRIGGGFFARVGNSYTQNWLDVPDQSKLAADLASPSGFVRSVVRDFRPHAVDFFEYGLEYDRRDDELSTTSGTWDALQVRLAPGGTEDLPYRYAQLDAIARGYVPIGRRVVVAGRLVGDVQVGDPPFYELARYQDTFALGGSMGVRGVPGQRYYGEVKTFGNLEVRTLLVRFRWLDKPWAIGGVGFFDAGRAWSELGHAHPDLDGASIGLKFGTGVGIRIRQGEAFVVRGDVAWSPDARPLGGYFAAGEEF
jgi:outer membrane protein assembly factor BamA